MSMTSTSLSKTKMRNYSDSSIPIYKEAITRESKKFLLKLIKALEDEEDGFEFLTPVDYKALNLPDYPQIIECPMDLSTLKSNLKNGKYKKVSDVIEDLNLIWSNCKVYNIENSDIYNSAVYMESLSARLLKKFVNKEPKKKSKKKVPENNKQEEEHKSLKATTINRFEDLEDSTMDVDKPTVIDPQELKRQVDSLNVRGLATVVKILQQFCPMALQDIYPDSWTIKHELLDADTIERIKCVLADSSLVGGC